MIYDNDIVMFAFRYALGRRTTAPITFYEWISKLVNLNELTPYIAQKIVEEIDYASTHNGLGDDCDKEIWESVKTLMLTKCGTDK